LTRCIGGGSLRKRLAQEVFYGSGVASFCGLIDREVSS
jgi:hypothetical protein